MYTGVRGVKSYPKITPGMMYLSVFLMKFYLFKVFIRKP